MKRVLVLGSSGSGKTTISHVLAAHTGLPVIHLDWHYWRPGWTEPPKEEWRAQVAELVRRPEWVMEGNFGGTLPERLAVADTVIVFDLPTWLCLWRVLKRLVLDYGRTRPDLAEGCPEQLDLKFLLYVLRFRRDHRPRLLAALEGFGGRIVMLRSPAEVRRFVEGLPGAAG
jgi:adenylate kinase family enzyme